MSKELWKPLRIFSYPWHISHQYSLYTALPHSEIYLYEPPYRRWGYEARPLPANARFVGFYEPGKYDLAILHLDGECADEEKRKGDLYKEMDKLITDIPKIVINHGTPFLPEVFGKYFKHIRNEDDVLKLSTDMCKDNMKMIIGKNTMVVNSEQAAEDWGWGIPIIHGMAGNPEEEYWDLEKEVRVAFIVSPAGWGHYYNRPYLEEVKKQLKDNGVDHTHLRVDTTLRSFDEYREYIGKTLISIHPYRESPMPRSRTEHMLSGGCVVTTNNHDIGKYFKSVVFKTTTDGKLIKDEGGRLIPSKDPRKAEIVFCDVNRPDDAVQKVLWLLDNIDITIQIGQNAKKKAQKVFSYKRYRNDWYKLLKSIDVL